MFKVVFFTTLRELNARIVIKLLDRNRYLPYLLTRRDCKFAHEMFIKDLSVINRDLKGVIIIDNLPKSYSYHKYNGLIIKSKMSNPKDYLLKEYSQY